MPLSDHALTTLSAVKMELEIPQSYNDEDAYLERLINSASASIENYCNRHFEKRDITKKYKGSGSRELILDHYPVNSVSNLIIDEESKDDYELVNGGKNGILYRDDGFPVIRRGTGGIVNDPVVNTEKYNIEVTYNAGYVLPKDATEENPRTLPYDLEDMVIEAVAARHARRGTGGNIASYKEEYISVTFNDKTGLPVTVLHRLENNGYVRVV